STATQSPMSIPRPSSTGAMPSCGRARSASVWDTTSDRATRGLERDGGMMRGRTHIGALAIRAAAWLLAGCAGLTHSACTHAAQPENAAPIVDAPAGTMRGTVSDGIELYRGIPYAEAPTGERRWKPPVAKAQWNGVRDATEFGPLCYQPQSRPTANNIYSEELGAMSEDCLTLNIWTPENAESAPVFVWVHGGALVSGASSFRMYDGTHLAEEGVV